jgi:hypothetical protein
MVGEMVVECPTPFRSVVLAFREYREVFSLCFPKLDLLSAPAATWAFLARSVRLS